MDPSVVEMNLSRGQLNGEKPTTKREGKDEEKQCVNREMTTERWRWRATDKMRKAEPHVVLRGQLPRRATQSSAGPQVPRRAPHRRRKPA